MKWIEFLATLSSIDRITLVGPLFNESHHEAENPTIYVDGGSRFRMAQSKFPMISIGDGDSSHDTLDELLPQNKDYSDLAYVLRHLPQSISTVEMLGFLGGRRDHEFAVLGEVHGFLTSRAHFTRVTLFDAQGEAIIGLCKGRVNLNVHGIFSVFVLEPTSFKISGACRYPLNRDRVMTSASSLGLSNVGSGAIEVESGSPVFIFLNA